MFDFLCVVMYIPDMKYEVKEIAIENSPSKWGVYEVSPNRADDWGKGAVAIFGDADSAYGMSAYLARVSESAAVDERVGIHLNGRLEAIFDAAVKGQDWLVRKHLLALLKFFPRKTIEKG